MQRFDVLMHNFALLWRRANARNVTYCLFHSVHCPHQNTVDTPVCLHFHPLLFRWAWWNGCQPGAVPKACSAAQWWHQQHESWAVWCITRGAGPEKGQRRGEKPVTLQSFYTNVQMAGFSLKNVAAGRARQHCFGLCAIQYLVPNKLHVWPPVTSTTLKGNITESHKLCGSQRLVWQCLKRAWLPWLPCLTLGLLFPLSRSCRGNILRMLHWMLYPCVCGP